MALTKGHFWDVLTYEDEASEDTKSNPPASSSSMCNDPPPPYAASGDTVANIPQK
ncbi:hypothetical protein PENSUB_8496 [Penicillium subrubescens]|uniref:Uncharacterized protein n=1 Tax=Penicillium subrubescens TaxID=1316194 RepID=A0A1Q5TFW7_9EURO|nr:hypothetical protein PENSUB_8496 [Penicillium subrubescens]